jgi:hypothetical protein
MAAGLLAPGEREILRCSGAKLVVLDEVGMNAEGRPEGKRRYHALAEGRPLLVTDARLLVLNVKGGLLHEAIYDLPFLHACLARLRRWNDQAAARIAQEEQGEGALSRWFHGRQDRRKFGLVDSVNMIASAERPRGVLGPTHYLLVTECTFRPVSAQKDEAIEGEEGRASGAIARDELKVQERRIGSVFTYKPMQISFHEKDQLDPLLALLSAKVPAMYDYVGTPAGLEADYGLPPASTQGMVGYRPADFEVS